jgi:hypothetical protein
MMGAESAKNPYSHQADQHERAAFDIKLVEHAQWSTMAWSPPFSPGGSDDTSVPDHHVKR